MRNVRRTTSFHLEFDFDFISNPSQSSKLKSNPALGVGAHSLEGTCRQRRRWPEYRLARGGASLPVPTTRKVESFLTRPRTCSAFCHRVLLLLLCLLRRRRRRRHAENCADAQATHSNGELTWRAAAAPEQIHAHDYSIFDLSFAPANLHGASPHRADKWPPAGAERASDHALTWIRVRDARLMNRSVPFFLHRRCASGNDLFRAAHQGDCVRKITCIIIVPHPQLRWLHCFLFTADHIARNSHSVLLCAQE